MTSEKKSQRWYSRLVQHFKKEPKPDGLQLLQKEPRRVVLARLPSKFLVDQDATVSVSDTYGLVRFTLHEAVLNDASIKGRYFATVSIGKQALTSKSLSVSRKHGTRLAWDAGATFVLQKDGATEARVAVFCEGTFNNRLVAWIEVDLANYFNINGAGGNGGSRGSNNGSSGSGMISGGSVVLEGEFDLVDPEDSSKVVGTVRASGSASSLRELERQVWEDLLLLADFDGNRHLEEGELAVLLRAFGAEVSDADVHAIFELADADGSGTVNVEELSALLALKDESESGGTADYFTRLVRRCPVDGAEMSADPRQQASNLLYVWLALSSAKTNHEADLKAGYLTEQQAAQSWMFKLSEWASHPLTITSAAKKKRRKKSYSAGGLRVGSAAAHILVYDREAKRVVEEELSPVLNLAMRKIYQSKLGRALMRQGLNKRFLAMSEKEGRYRDSPESAAEIVPFVESFRGQIDVEEAERPISEYPTFNEFFYRKLKPGARPVAEPENNDVVVSAADCRLQVFFSVDEATRFWVKGRNFSVAGLLADTDPARTFSSVFAGGTMAIFRLAPQDYHRFHAPVTGTVASITDVPGDLLTVNPIAVNSAFHDVFTINKRSVMIIDTPTYGKVAFVAIGATLVGSIAWTVAVGDKIEKGGELGYFSFGGSTCITLFPDGAVTWDADLSANAQRSLETLVKMGERIGVKAGSGGEESFAERARVMQRMQTMAKNAGAIALEERPAEERKLATGELEARSSTVFSFDVWEEGLEDEEDEAESSKGGENSTKSGSEQQLTKES